MLLRSPSAQEAYALQEGDPTTYSDSDDTSDRNNTYKESAKPSVDQEIDWTESDFADWPISEFYSEERHFFHTATPDSQRISEVHSEEKHSIYKGTPYDQMISEFYCEEKQFNQTDTSESQRFSEFFSEEKHFIPTGTSKNVTETQENKTDTSEGPDNMSDLLYQLFLIL